MNSKMRSNKAVWVVATSVVVAALLLIILFVSQANPDRQDSIVLPAGPTDLPQNEVISDGQDNFIKLTTENVATVLQTMARPTSYYQRYSVSVGSEGKQHTKTVDLWVNHNILRAEITRNQQVQSILTDGNTLYLWYDSTPQYVTLELAKGVSMEDVVGLPDFDAYLHIQQDQIVEADYLLPENSDVQCIYVSIDKGDRVFSRYWVSLENGLLYLSDVVENDDQVYAIRQTAFEQMSAEDDRFSAHFLLPDGQDPFTSEAEELQP